MTDDIVYVISPTPCPQKHFAPPSQFLSNDYDEYVGVGTKGCHMVKEGNVGGIQQVCLHPLWFEEAEFGCSKLLFDLRASLASYL